MKHDNNPPGFEPPLSIVLAAMWTAAVQAEGSAEPGSAPYVAATMARTAADAVLPPAAPKGWTVGRALRWLASQAEMDDAECGGLPDGCARVWCPSCGGFVVGWEHHVGGGDHVFDCSVCGTEGFTSTPASTSAEDECWVPLCVLPAAHPLPHRVADGLTTSEHIRDERRSRRRREPSAEVDGELREPSADAGVDGQLHANDAELELALDEQIGIIEGLLVDLGVELDDVEPSAEVDAGVDDGSIAVELADVEPSAEVDAPPIVATAADDARDAIAASYTSPLTGYRWHKPPPGFAALVLEFGEIGSGCEVENPERSDRIRHAIAHMECALWESFDKRTSRDHVVVLRNSYADLPLVPEIIAMLEIALSDDEGVSG